MIRQYEATLTKLREDHARRLQDLCAQVLPPSHPPSHPPFPPPLLSRLSTSSLASKIFSVRFSGCAVEDLRTCTIRSSHQLCARVCVCVCVCVCVYVCVFVYQESIREQ
jgi:hypothetical protein